LHSAGSERSSRPLADIPFADLGNLVVGVGQFRFVTPGILLVGDADSSAVAFNGMQGGRKLVLLNGVRAGFAQQIIDYKKSKEA